MHQEKVHLIAPQIGLLQCVFCGQRSEVPGWLLRLSDTTLYHSPKGILSTASDGIQDSSSSG